MLISEPAQAPAASRRGRPRRSRQERRTLRSGAFDLLAVVAAVTLVALGLANLYFTGAPELAHAVAELEQSRQSDFMEKA